MGVATEILPAAGFASNTANNSKGHLTMDKTTQPPTPSADEEAERDLFDKWFADRFGYYIRRNQVTHEIVERQAQAQQFEELWLAGRRFNATVMIDMLPIDWEKRALLASAVREAVRVASQGAAEPGEFTYASKQATNCACCGKYKHTPLRVDRMEGYVCLTCIDERLEQLLDAEAEGAAEPRDGWKWVPINPTVEMLQAAENDPSIVDSEDCWRAMLAASPADRGAEPPKGEAL